MFDWTKPTTQIIGGFKEVTTETIELLQKAITTNGQAVICIKMGESDLEEITNNLIQSLSEVDLHIDKDYIIVHLPNVVQVTYADVLGAQ